MGKQNEGRKKRMDGTWQQQSLSVFVPLPRVAWLELFSQKLLTNEVRYIRTNGLLRNIRFVVDSDVQVWHCGIRKMTGVEVCKH